LFGEEVDEDEEREDKRPEQIKNLQVKSRLNWLMTCENVADFQRFKLSDVFNLPIIEFLNSINYIVWKNKELEKKYKK
jgi:hypothetical protein